MLSSISRRAFSFACIVGLAWSAAAFAAEGPAPKNMFANPSFELGRVPWTFSHARGTEATWWFVDDPRVDGRVCAEVHIKTVKSWGVQFGQIFDPAGRKGRTYTFAALVKAVGAPVRVKLQIERHAKPWDHAAAMKPVLVSPDRWTELHTTFRVEKDFPQGWFAYVMCTQPNSVFRVDMFRLYEGDYIPYEQLRHEEMLAQGVRVFDAGAALPSPSSASALAARGKWKRISPETASHAFRGDAVVSNDLLALVVHRRGGAELLSRLDGRLTRRAGIRLADETKAAAGWRLRLVENDPAAAVVECVTAGGAGLRFELAMGQPFVKITPVGPARRVRVEAPTRFLVAPDFFADDLVLDARTMPIDRTEIPADNFLLHMVGQGDGIVMTIWKSTGQDVRVALTGKGDARKVVSTEIQFGPEKKLWVAALADRNIWHVHPVTKADRGREIALDWRCPFLAQWRVDWRCEDGFVDSWLMAIEQPDGVFVKPAGFGGFTRLKKKRRRWTSVLGWFPYPCWIDRAGRGHLQPLKKKPLKFAGPALIYPINRVRQTPLDKFTVVDVVRNTLGVGPCEYVLDVEAQRTRFRGRATCATRDKLNAIYAKHEQKKRRKEVEQALVDVLVFVKFIRARIEQYMQFAREMTQYLEEQKRKHPELKDALDDLERLAKQIPERYARRREKIRTPAYVAALTDKFRRTLLDYEGPDALAKCKEITHAIVIVGGNQDALVGECRVAAKRLRQRAALLAAQDPRLAPIAAEIRRRTHQILRNPTSYEAPQY